MLGPSIEWTSPDDAERRYKVNVHEVFGPLGRPRFLVVLPHPRILTKTRQTCYHESIRTLAPHSMTSSRLHRLRLAFEALEPRTRIGRPSLPLHLLLPVPIRQRLILLCLIEGEQPATIKRLLKVSDAEIAEAADLPFPRGPVCTWLEPETGTERRLRQLLFPSTAVLLIGERVPPCLRDLSLKERLMVYCALVEELHREDIQQLLHCTEHAIKTALTKVQRQVGGA